MKKLAIIGLIMVMSTGLVACGSDSEPKVDNSTGTQVEVNNDAKESKKEKFKLNPEQFSTDNGITLKAIDVEYDMANNVGNSFLIEGKAILDSYYNFEYRDDRKDKFSVRVRPNGTDAGDYWHVYFDREEFKEFYEVLKRGEQDVLIKAVSPKEKYKEGMGNLATGEVAAYDKSVLEKEDTVSKDMTAFVTENNLELKARDVEFDIDNYLDQSFAIEGKAALGDYFNYNFRGKEKEYFNVKLTSKSGSSTSHWNLYFNREEFKDLFEQLKTGEKDIVAKVVMPKNLYEDGMNNMAVGEVVKVIA